MPLGPNLRASLCGERQVDHEASPAQRDRLQLDAASVRPDDPVTDAQPEPGPLALRLGGEERIEDPAQDLRRDARPVIRDADLHAVGRGAGRNGDPAPGAQASRHCSPG